MRVTNDQAKALVICGKYDWCEECEKYDDGCPLHGCGIIFEKELATDLLEARETIEKQEALIKEMREEINLTLRDFEKIDEVCKMANVMPFSLTKKKLFELMEKTKDYA